MSDKHLSGHCKPLKKRTITPGKEILEKKMWSVGFRWRKMETAA